MALPAQHALPEAARARPCTTHGHDPQECCQVATEPRSPSRPRLQQCLEEQLTLQTPASQMLLTASPRSSPPVCTAPGQGSSLCSSPYPHSDATSGRTEKHGKQTPESTKSQRKAEPAASRPAHHHPAGTPGSGGQPPPASTPLETFTAALTAEPPPCRLELSHQAPADSSSFPFTTTMLTSAKTPQEGAEPHTNQQPTLPTRPFHNYMFLAANKHGAAPHSLLTATAQALGSLFHNLFPHVAPGGEKKRQQQQKKGKAQGSQQPFRELCQPRSSHAPPS